MASLVSVMVGVLQRPLHRGKGNAGVLSVNYLAIKHLANRARQEGFVHCGSLEWLSENEKLIKSAFVIPMLEWPERLDSLVCSVLLIDDSNRLGWMRMSILSSDFSRFEKCDPEEIRMIALSLAMRGTHLTSVSDKLSR